MKKIKKTGQGQVFSVLKDAFLIGPISNGVGRAFTLIEILIAAAITTAIVTLTVGSFTQSVSFGSNSTSERITRQAARTFMDYFSRSLKQVNTYPVYMQGNNACPANTGSSDYVEVTNAVNSCAVTGYRGSGYVLVRVIGANGQMTLADPVNGGGARLVIFPTPTNSDDYLNGYKWMLIGTPTGEPQPLVMKSKGDDVDASRILKYSKCLNKNCNRLLGHLMEWEQVGQVLSSEVDAATFKMNFSGVSPKSVVFSANGAVASYSSPLQPYVTISLQLRTASDTTQVSTYETTITSRDYQFAFPQCSNTPGISCL